MPCVEIPDLPASSTYLSGEEIMPLVQLAATRRSTSAAVAQSATTWDLDHDYREGFVVKDNDGNLYVAVTDNIANDPSDHDAAFWKPLLVLVNTTLTVPAEFTTITLALEYLEGATIAEDATVTISVADGVYNLTTTQLALNHPYGHRIQLIGNTTTPANVSLGFTALTAPPTSPYLDSNSGSIYRNSGGTWGLIDGFTITRTGGSAVFGHCGILSFNSRINVGANMVISGFFFPLACQAGTLICAGTGAGAPIIQPDAVANAAGIYANAAHIEAPFITINGTNGGAVLQEGSEVRLNDFTTAAGLSDVFILSGNSTLIVPNGTAGDAGVYISSIGSATIVDTGTTYGTASSGDIDMEGLLTRNGTLLSTAGAVFPFTLVTAGGLSIQRIVSGTESVFVTDDGLNTEVLDLELAAAGNQGINIEAATGNVQVPVSLELGSTAPALGLEAGTATLDGAGTVTVLTPWVTAATEIVVGAGELAITGTLAVTAITPATSFVITSSAGAADGGLDVKWIAVVY